MSELQRARDLVYSAWWRALNKPEPDVAEARVGLKAAIDLLDSIGTQGERTGPAVTDPLAATPDEAPQEAVDSESLFGGSSDAETSETAELS